MLHLLYNVQDMHHGCVLLHGIPNFSNTGVPLCPLDPRRGTTSPPPPPPPSPRPYPSPTASNGPEPPPQNTVKASIPTRRIYHDFLKLTVLRVPKVTILTHSQRSIATVLYRFPSNDFYFNDRFLLVNSLELALRYKYGFYSSMQNSNRRVLGDGHGGHVHPPKISNLGNCNCNVCKYALKFKKGLQTNCRKLPGGLPSAPVHPPSWGAEHAPVKSWCQLTELHRA